MKGVEPIKAEKEKAAEEYKKYAEALKTRKDQVLEDLKKLNYHIKEGRKVLNIYDVFKTTGLNDLGQPKLALARADRKTVEFAERARGAGIFYNERKWKINSEDLDLPEGTFPESILEREDGTIIRRGVWIHGQQNASLREWIATVPMVPPEYLPKGSLENYFILWEVEEWTDVKKTPKASRDPFLLRRISPNMFVIFAEWDLTDLEMAVLEGRQ